MTHLIFTALFPFCGLGAGARGFLDAEVRLFGQRATFRALGGIDFDQEGCADFERLTGAPAWCVDIEGITADELRARYGASAPDVVFLSPPCKGSSGLLSAEKAADAKYQRMNQLAVLWTRRMLEAWPDPPKLVLLENVPRITSRARSMLTSLRKLLRAAGYVFHDGYHDCGELGGLAQHRRRYLLVARLARKLPPLLYQPPKRRVRGCGEVLGALPMPEDPSAGPLHRLPRISWLNWVRLALIPAGGDWRDLEGVLTEGQPRREQWARHAVAAWDAPSKTVAGGGSNGATNVADGRLTHWNKYRVVDWETPAGTVIGATRPGSGAPNVADVRFGHVDRLRAWDEPAGTVTRSPAPSSGAQSVADPRQWYRGTYGIGPWDSPAPTVTGRASPSTGRFSVSDPRVSHAFDAGYAVLDWSQAARTIAGTSAVGCGAYSVADPRALPSELRLATEAELDRAAAEPHKPPPFLPVIVAADGTWHRPMTTLELAALQGLPTRLDDAPLVLAGSAVNRWRERIGNAVPPPTARAMAEQMLVTLAQGALETFALRGSGDVWVEPDRRGALRMKEDDHG